MEFTLERISNTYQVRRIQTADIPVVLELFQGNPVFFEHMHSVATAESIVDDLKALPPGKGYEDKYYVGFYQGETLVAVMDLVLAYPDGETALIGLFMVHQSQQGKGVGSDIVQELAAYLAEEGFSAIGLGYVKTNMQSRHFWLKNGFCPTGIETQEGDYTVVVMERRLRESDRID